MASGLLHFECLGFTHWAHPSCCRDINSFTDLHSECHSHTTKVEFSSTILLHGEQEILIDLKHNEVAFDHPPKLRLMSVGLKQIGTRICIWPRSTLSTNSKIKAAQCFYLESEMNNAQIKIVDHTIIWNTKCIIINCVSYQLRNIVL